MSGLKNKEKNIVQPNTIELIKFIYNTNKLSSLKSDKRILPIVELINTVEKRETEEEKITLEIVKDLLKRGYFN